MVFLLIKFYDGTTLSPVIGRLDEEYISKLDILKSKNKNFNYLKNLIEGINKHDIEKEKYRTSIEFIFVNDESDKIMGDKFNSSCKSLIELCNSNKIDDCRKITSQLNIFTLFKYDFYDNRFKRFECVISESISDDEDYKDFIILSHTTKNYTDCLNRFLFIRRELSDYNENAGKKFKEGDRVILKKGASPRKIFNENDELYISEIPEFDKFYWMNYYLIFNKTQEFGLYFHESDILQYK